MKKKIIAMLFVTLVGLLIALSFLLNIVSEKYRSPVLKSLPECKKAEEYMGEGIQDYTDYKKYYYESGKVNLEENEYFIKVSSESADEIKSYFQNFEKWVVHERYKDRYDFNPKLIDTEDYYYIENCENYEPYSRYNHKYDAYNVYFYDSQSDILYCIHNNI